MLVVQIWKESTGRKLDLVLISIHLRLAVIRLRGHTVCHHKCIVQGLRSWFARLGG